MKLATTTRRSFLTKTSTAAAALWLSPRSARAADARVEVLLDEPIGTIAPELYGHFAEHLGGVVYDGIWVGEGSKIPNQQGIRTALVEHLRRIRASVIRWPGGCFADSYDWRDGIGPRASRPRRTNFWIDTSRPTLPNGAPSYEPNEFGTVEFARFCRLAGAQPYLAANLRSLPARDFYQWVEFCNSPAGSTTLAETRAAQGEREPLGIRLWGVGNESWGCGGDFKPQDYASEFRRFTSWVPGYGAPLRYVASGPNAGEIDWTRGFFHALVEKGTQQLERVHSWGLHHYSWNVSSGRTQDWEKGKGDALAFSVEEWYELLRDADKVEGLIKDHWTAMGEVDTRHRVKLAVDEWGAWHRPGTEAHPTHLLGQGSTLRDAVLAGLTLDTFNRHADKVAMANVAQLVNCLQALFVAHEDKFVTTPTFHVFEMYAAHQEGEAVRAVWNAPSLTYSRAGQPATFWGLAGSVSKKGKELTLTAVNPHVSEAREAEIVFRGGTIAACRARVLTDSDLHAHNSFDRPDAVRPVDAPARVSGATVAFRFPPASVVRLTATLA
jgi:alpha-N-arabinofuranosidase